MKKHLFVISFSLAGLLAGFAYWKYVGCLSGTCRIKSVWYMSTIYGGLVGYLTGDIIISIFRWVKKRKNDRNRKV